MAVMTRICVQFAQSHFRSVAASGTHFASQASTVKYTGDVAVRPTVCAHVALCGAFGRQYAVGWAVWLMSDGPRTHSQELAQLATHTASLSNVARGDALRSQPPSCMHSQRGGGGSGVQ